MLQDLKVYLKVKMVKYAVLSVAAGYGIGFSVEDRFNLLSFFVLLVGAAAISAGTLSMNQVQEIDKDKLMDRTKHRPLASGAFTPKFAFTLSFSLMLIGLGCLYYVSPLSSLIGLSIIVLYNGLYTMYWKKNLPFAAVPGAIPGALPIVMGYAAASNDIFSAPSIYLFLVMFLWQMPHFWSLAIRYADDYAKGKFPVLPAVIGAERTKYHISFYVWAFAFLGIMSPFFVTFAYAYFLLVIPFAIVLVWKFVKYFHTEDQKAWLPFFLLTNFTMMAFIFSPLIDKWTPMILKVSMGL